MPSTVCLVLMAAGLVLLWRCHRTMDRPRHARAGLALTGLSTLILYAFSTPWVASLLAASLENQYPAIRPEDAPTADAIVVLAGGEGGYQRPDGSIELFTHHAGDRFEMALRLFKAGKAPLIAFGGGGVLIPGGPTMSETVRQRAIDRGVPESSILVGGPARYTEDESEGMATLLAAHGARRILLCTSAYHTPRATLLYRRCGVQVTPVPCDFETRGRAETFSIQQLLPRAVALAQSENALKEWFGLAVYRLTGSG